MRTSQAGWPLLTTSAIAVNEPTIKAFLIDFEPAPGMGFKGRRGQRHSPVASALVVRSGQPVARLSLFEAGKIVHGVA